MAQPYVSSISPLWESMPVSDTSIKGNRETPDVPFAQIFQSAVDNVRQTEDEKNKLEYLLATGQLDNPAELTIASTKAATAVELLVQLRNKALDSYSELMRTSL